MAAVWSDEGKLRRWLDVELAALEGWAEVGAVPGDAAREIRDRALPPSPARVAELEATLHHDTAAFVDAVAEQLGPEGRWVHYGLTSSDVVDTALALQIRDGGAVLVSGALAAVVSVMLTVQTPLVTPDFALRDTIVVLAGVVVGGLNRPIPATLGGFAIGFATGVLGGALPSNQSQYLPTFVFAVVIVVLLIRPRGLFDFSKTVERV